MSLEEILALDEGCAGCPVCEPRLPRRRQRLSEAGALGETGRPYACERVHAHTAEAEAITPRRGFP